jgi:hypothetical protein
MTQTTFLTQQLKSKLQNTTEKKWVIEEASGGFESLVCGDDWTIIISRNGQNSKWTITVVSRKADTGVPIEQRTAEDNEHLIEVAESIAEDLSL